MGRVLVIKQDREVNSALRTENTLFEMDVEKMLDSLPEKPIFDLVVTSPPYNIGKEYEKKLSLDNYIQWQKRIIQKIYIRLKDTGSICWQVGNYVDQGVILPLDYVFAPIFQELHMQLRNRIIWHFGHGLHNQKRFSGRYEVILWYTKTDQYSFDLNPIRIASKYPGKRFFKGPNKGKLSGNPLGKNPEDVWEVPNVKSNHIEKTLHPCQFPVGLIERLVLSMTKPGQLVFDPFSGSSSSGVASIIHGRVFWGCEIKDEYVKISIERLEDAIEGNAKYRPFDRPIYDPSQSSLSHIPPEWKESQNQ